ncbi:hypothetical protein BD560DRAFT_388718 [Blakeslea trispora]|nr:hypothetical protein BD560DRAFT_388718 [Blakeslea trispora]
MSTRQVGLLVDIVQHYIKVYKDHEEKRLPGAVRAKKDGVSKKLTSQHTTFLVDLYNKKTLLHFYGKQEILWCLILQI